MTKNILISILLLSLLILPTQAELPSDKTTIAVSGQSILKAEPDVAYVLVGVEQTERTATAAQKTVAQNMSKVLASLKNLGIPKEKLETTEFTLRPKYEYRGGKREFLGYTASNQIRVTLDDLDKVGKVIDSSIAAGANNVSDVSFSVKDTDPLKKKALEKAFVVAKEKAETIAKASNLTLIKIQNIQESAAEVFPRSIQAFKAEGEAMETPILAGKIEIRGNLSVVYECAAKK